MAIYPSPNQDMFPQNDATKNLAIALYEAHQGHINEAQQAFIEASNLDRSSIPVHMHYAAFLARQQGWDAAKQIFADAIQQDSEEAARWLAKEQQRSPSDLALVYLRALHCSTQPERYPEARACWEQLLQSYPDQEALLYNYAALLGSLEQWDAAEQQYQRALEIFPNNVKWLIAYGTLLEKRGREKAALLALQKASQIRRDDLDLSERVRVLEAHSARSEQAQGKALLARYRLDRDEESAARLVAEALELDSACALAHVVRAKILERQGSLTQAESTLARAIEIEPNNSEFQNELQDFRSRIESLHQRVQVLISQARETTDRESARALLVQALNLIHDDADGLVAYAQLLLPDQPQEAEKCLQSALTAMPGHYEAHRQYALLLLRQNRAEAEQHCRLALQMQPNDEHLLAEYVDWLIECNRPEDAEAVLQSAAETMPLTGHLQTQQAILWAKLGRLDAALEKLNELVQSNPHDPVLQREFAVVLRQKRQYALAEEHFQTALDVNPEDGRTHHEYALFLQERQRIQQAQEHIRVASMLLPNDEKINADAAMIEQDLIRFDQLKTDLAFAWFLENEENASFDQIRLCLQSALDKDHNNITVLKDYASFLLRHRRDLKQAEEMIEHTLNLVPEEPALQSLMSDIRAIMHPLPSTSMESAIPSVYTPPPMAPSSTLPVYTTPTPSSPIRKSFFKRLKDFLGIS